jgi:hypothetical protein
MAGVLWIIWTIWRDVWLTETFRLQGPVPFAADIPSYPVFCWPDW